MRRIALASSTGLMVDEHFGRSPRFVIVEADGIGWRIAETRLLPPARPDDSRGDFQRAADLIADCDGVFAAKIGPHALQLLSDRGVRAFEAPYAVEAVLNQLIKEGLLGTEA